MKPTINRPGKSTPPRQPARPAGTNGAPARSAQSAQANQFAASVISEMRRVTWPTREEWVTATLLTLGLVLVVGLFTAAADHLFGWLIGLITGNASR